MNVVFPMAWPSMNPSYRKEVETARHASRQGQAGGFDLQGSPYRVGFGGLI